MLKKIECIIQPFKLEEVKEALKKIAVEGMTVTEVKGCGRQRGYTGEYAPDAPIHLLPKVKLEIVTEEEKVEEMISTIQSLAKTNKIGAGKIFVIPVEDVLRIRTKEREVKVPGFELQIAFLRLSINLKFSSLFLTATRKNLSLRPAKLLQSRIRIPFLAKSSWSFVEERSVSILTRMKLACGG